MKNFGIILLAGSSSRFASQTKKQFYLIKDKPVLFYSINAFEKSNYIDEIIVVCAKEDVEKVTSLLKDYSFKKIKCIVKGGNSRQKSVFNGLAKIDEDGKVLIHDAARPLVSQKIIEELIKGLDEFDGVVPALKVVDTIVKADDNSLVSSFEDRNYLYRVQTPQAFITTKIKAAHVMYSDLNLTDDSQLMIKYGGQVKIIEGEEKLQKITKLEDTNAIKAYIEEDERLQN